MIIYLDNAATTFPKPDTVYHTVDDTLRRLGVNPGRGSYRLVLEAGQLVYSVRETVAEFFNLDDPAGVVFTANATEAINLALFGLLQPGDLVVTTAMEHNAISRPLHALAARGVKVRKVPVDSIGVVSPEAIRKAANSSGRKARMIALSHCSNVTGTIQPVEEIGTWCRKQGILLLVDAAQSAGHLPIDMQAMGIDLLAAAGHKSLLGPPGTGLLCLSEGLLLQPLLYGGTGGNSLTPSMPEELPERLECGTLNSPALAGLQTGIDYVRNLGLEQVRRHKSTLLANLIEGLKALPGALIYGTEQADSQGGVLSFNLDGHDPAEVGYRLDEEYGICVRTGLHCAPDAHRSLGTLPAGTVRVSPGLFNSTSDIDTLLKALATITRSRTINSTLT